MVQKELTLAGSDADKRIVLYFEGVYNQSELWINGKKANYNVYGYTSYRVDITPYLNAPGTPNVIAMKVVNAGRNSRWYAGSGIFRHVWLIKTNKLYLDKWDTFVNASELQKKEAVIQFSTIVHNEGLQNQSGKIGIKIYSPAGNEVFSTSQDVILSEGTPVATSFSLKSPSYGQWIPLCFIQRKYPFPQTERSMIRYLFLLVSAPFLFLLRKAFC